MLGRLLNLLPLKTLHGYESPELVETIFRKTLLYHPTEPWPEMQDATAVLDFGGGCGIHYKQANHPTVRWAVVETPAMVARARSLETYHLRFFTEIDRAAQWLGAVDVIHSNGALQYAPNQIETIARLCEVGAQRMLWFRLLLGESRDLQVSLLEENGPGKIGAPLKKIAYSRAAIPEADFIAAHRSYQIDARGPDWFRFSRAPAGSCRPQGSAERA